MKKNLLPIYGFSSYYVDYNFLLKMKILMLFLLSVHQVFMKMSNLLSKNSCIYDEKPVTLDKEEINSSETLNG